MQKTITICLSGGIDSAIAGYLLKKQGFHVKGIYMKNWATPTTKDAIPKIKSNFDMTCPFHKDYLYAQSTAEYLGIDLKLIDLQKEYWNYVFNPLLEGLSNNTTPNPDIDCNRLIKFSKLRQHIDTEYMATGHYCQIENNRLKRAIDQFKDQSYFLCDVQDLSKVVFPLGALLKLQVKWLAYQLSIADSTPNIFTELLRKRESMGICFVGKQDFGAFVDQFVAPSIGQIIDIYTNKSIGEHKGTHLYTIGQGLRLSGGDSKLYILHKIKNNLYVGKYDHPLLFTTSVPIPYPIEQLSSSTVYAKIRHPSKLVKCKIENNFLIFASPIRALTPGQVVCLYQDDFVIGSFPISKEWSLNRFLNFKDKTCSLR